MPALLIKNLPAPLHRKLREAALRNHRSMTRQALAILEEGLEEPMSTADWPAPFQGPIPLTPRMVNRAKRQGRA